MSRVQLLDPAKFRLQLVAIVGGFVLAVVGVIVGDTAATAGGTGIVSLIVGYLHGNGRLAATGAPPVPVLGTPEQLDRKPGEKAPE